MAKGEARGRRLQVHIKNNRDGEAVFRFTPERLAEALGRNADVRPHVEARIDWDLDDFDRSMRTADALITGDLPTEDLAARAPNLKGIHIIGAGIDHLLPLGWLPPGVALVNDRGVHAPKSGEYGAMAVLMLNNHLPRMVTQARAAAFEPISATPAPG